MQLDSTSELLPTLCACGCGQETKIASQTNKCYGWIKGRPLRFINGHNKSRYNSPQNVWDKIDVRTPNECWLFFGKSLIKGYGIFWINHDGILAHRHVYDICYGVKNPKSKICHACDTPLCCNPLHLFEGTQLDNVQDMVSKNRMPRGSARKRAKLHEAQIPEIRTMLHSKCTYAEISERFGVGISTIRCIQSGRTWKHVP